MSPTIQTLVLGLGLLTVLAFAGRLMGGVAGLRRAAWVFMPLWLGYCLYHMYVGVSGHGYSVGEELPFLVLNFGVPALAAWLLPRFLGR